MTKATEVIIEHFPNLKVHLKSYESILMAEETLQSLDSTQQTFLKLAWYFQKPDQNNFDLNSLYRNLEGEWLQLALELIYIFFKEDTYLIKDSSFLFFRDNSLEDYLNQAQFAQFLSKNGLKYSRMKLRTYYERGHIPKEDLLVGTSKYWHIDTCKNYLKQVETVHE
ncbi:hypothetical protein [Bacillus sp. 1P06AnD]|uniref:hypothetical protein n=1 Tax=Bacillus sp. 1P06AnD TaxID=3132208 RepID=UPI00399FA6A4